MQSAALSDRESDKATLQRRSSTNTHNWSTEGYSDYYGDYPDHNYYDVTPPQDGIKPITDATDYIALLNKAIISARKDEIYLWDEMEASLGPKAFKWIGRALASVYRYASHVAHEMQYYDNKIEGLQDEQAIERATSKRENWQYVGTLPRVYDAIGRIQSIASLYAYETERLQCQLRMQRAQERPIEEIEEMERKLNEAISAKFLGSSASTTFDESVEVLKLELRGFDKEQSVDNAVKVLAWMQKIRDLLPA